MKNLKEHIANALQPVIFFIVLLITFITLYITKH